MKVETKFTAFSFCFRRKGLKDDLLFLLEEELCDVEFLTRVSSSITFKFIKCVHPLKYDACSQHCFIFGEIHFLKV